MQWAREGKLPSQPADGVCTCCAAVWLCVAVRRTLLGRAAPSSCACSSWKSTPTDHLWSSSSQSSFTPTVRPHPHPPPHPPPHTRARCCSRTAPTLRTSYCTHSRSERLICMRSCACMCVCVCSLYGRRHLSGHSGESVESHLRRVRHPRLHPVAADRSQSQQSCQRRGSQAVRREPTRV